MAVVTRKGLKLAARNLAALPFRVLLFAFEWVLRLTIIAVLVFVLAVGGVGWYFYAVKANQPMQIDPRFARTLPPEGMTFGSSGKTALPGGRRLTNSAMIWGYQKAMIIVAL
ncbi:hypothetical protein BECAL_03007 [Bellilinea caldifistulae]|uniref:Uncharacterized protein n=1 Tax=Bellilinea caldifistulae TaxID=360411 RepID=A0A0P6XI32_9CHLR|nr:hypothetical protein [Bellilinea caldifistulae]KPL74597.1 hypothetical protein AC812_12445 [Bellilinea caldifistulae]GAP11813.1 hypothetical protein BECAL_03007 [Bellilinea caldifistulae]